MLTKRRAYCYSFCSGQRKAFVGKSSIPTVCYSAHREIGLLKKKFSCKLNPISPVVPAMIAFGRVRYAKLNLAWNKIKYQFCRLTEYKNEGILEQILCIQQRTIR